MAKEQKAINYYVLYNRLKDVIRTGWQTYRYDENFKAVSNYVINNKIGEKRTRSCG